MAPSVVEKVEAALPSTQELKEEVVEASKKSFKSLRDLAAGGVGGVCAVVVGHPFDLVKVRLQTAEKGVYSGAMDVVRKTIAREGMRRVGFGAIMLGSWGADRTSVGSVCGCVCAAGGRDADVWVLQPRPLSGQFT